MYKHIQKRKCDPKKTTWSHLKAILEYEHFELKNLLFYVKYNFFTINLQNSKILTLKRFVLLHDSRGRREELASN